MTTIVCLGAASDDGGVLSVACDDDHVFRCNHLDG